mmetsp:Transcript_54425/g.158143  ORF Transcript_54425/g.158143 Transcript_54425/m.158143 type:complete len:275 (+) Transcript_54425:266-1090(+)
MGLGEARVEQAALVGPVHDGPWDVRLPCRLRAHDLALKTSTLRLARVGNLQIRRIAWSGEQSVQQVHLRFGFDVVVSVRETEQGHVELRFPQPPRMRPLDGAELHTREEVNICDCNVRPPPTLAAIAHHVRLHPLRVPIDGPDDCPAVDSEATASTHPDIAILMAAEVLREQQTPVFGVSLPRQPLLQVTGHDVHVVIEEICPREGRVSLEHDVGLGQGLPILTTAALPMAVGFTLRRQDVESRVVALIGQIPDSHETVFRQQASEGVQGHLHT